MIAAHHAIPQKIGLRAWENGMEALLAPSAAQSRGAQPGGVSGQRPVWEVSLTGITAGE